MLRCVTTDLPVPEGAEQVLAVPIILGQWRHGNHEAR